MWKHNFSANFRSFLSFYERTTEKNAVHVLLLVAVRSNQPAGAGIIIIGYFSAQMEQWHKESARYCFLIILYKIKLLLPTLMWQK